MAKFEWIFMGGAARARGDIPPKWSETGVGGLYMPGKVKIGPNRIKTNHSKSMRGQIVTGKRVEIDPWRPQDRAL